ncbi:hypothetical protein [Nocardia lijiangensis]|uniref:hypothetical protein n=1 Tax=Nocardia lijiangensis TaxID=299618 RepID=UPI003D73555E
MDAGSGTAWVIRGLRVASGVLGTGAPSWIAPRTVGVSVFGERRRAPGEVVT